MGLHRVLSNLPKMRIEIKFKTIRFAKLSRYEMTHDLNNAEVYYFLPVKCHHNVKLRLNSDLKYTRGTIDILYVILKEFS